jgi:hypothetical protein
VASKQRKSEPSSGSRSGGHDGWDGFWPLGEPTVMAWRRTRSSLCEGGKGFEPVDVVRGLLIVYVLSASSTSWGRERLLHPGLKPKISIHNRPGKSLRPEPWPWLPRVWLRSCLNECKQNSCRSRYKNVLKYSLS